MLGKNLSKSKQMVMALCLAFVIVSTAAIGAWALGQVFSNHLEQTVNVPEEAVTITATTLLPDAPAKGVVYEMTFSVDFTVDASDAHAALTVSSPGISEGDVTVAYLLGEPATVLTGDDELTFILGIPATDGSVTLLVTFYAAGAYTTDLVVEATA